MRGYTTVTITYEQVREPATRTGPCPGCGRKTRRNRTFTETINPFNKIADKSRPKTPAEVRASVRAKAQAWQPDPEVFRHDACRAVTR